MKAIFIYGPPAAGKLTVANEIAKSRNYRVFHNHTLVGSVATLFPFGDKKAKPIRERLSNKFRLEIYEEAAKQKIDFVTTYGGGGSERFKFFNDVENVINRNKGKIFFVQLAPSKEALLKRVSSKSRRGNKVDTQELLLKNLSQRDYYDKYPNSEHLTIDNSKLTPKEVANRIIEYYRL